MKPQALFLLVVLWAGEAISQNVALPLASVAIEGSSIPQPAILEAAGLRMGVPIDKEGIEHACKNLEASGLFASIAYRYAPGPKGYALKLTLADPAPLSDAAIDVPGADENEAWQWLVSKFYRFDRKAPPAEAGQKYLARQIEQHLAERLRGQSLAVRVEFDLQTRKLVLSFQPERLPRIQSVALTGNQAIASAELLSVLNRVTVNEEYTARKFAGAVELNLRPVYEQRGLYRVRFAPGAPQWTDAGVAVNLAITEGEPYQLGKVEFVGENLPVEGMLSAAKLPTGKLANWQQIQEGIWELEKVVKRSGFYEATASTDRAYDDAARVLNLRIRIRKGPLYRFGDVRFAGLSPKLQERAQQIWQPKPGDPYNYAYPNEFMREFSRVVDFRNFRKYKAEAQKGTGDHVVDISVVFEGR